MFSPGGFGQTVAVFDKSGKAVSTSKHILNVFKDAKAAYLERKAEILAAREASRNGPAPRIRRAYTVDDISVSSSRRSDRSRRTHRESRHGEKPRERRSELKRRHSDGHSKGEENTTRAKPPRLSIISIDQAQSPAPPSDVSPKTPLPPYSAQDPKPITRHSTFHEESTRSPGHLISPRRTQSSDAIDMDLAYGDAPPNLMQTSKRYDEAELSGLVGRAKFLLDEAKCVQHSVQATLTNLQKNPEAMAAVALTLGEISTLVKKMSPGALSKIRVLAPSVFALLTSPQFLIAAGVGVGVTVIALGGYKIIKKIQAKKEEEETPEQMIALSSEVSRIETWRQGIADAENASVGTSVDGEFITPLAANLSKLNLAEARAEASRERRTRSQTSRRSRTVRSTHSRSSGTPSIKDITNSASSSTPKDGASSNGKQKKPTPKPKPKPSPLRSLFKP